MKNENDLTQFNGHTIPFEIDNCIQCGMCGASCPVSYAMDHTPREIIALIKEGMLYKALMSNTLWICSSCYLCTVRCPAKINLPNFMYKLRHLAIDNGLHNGNSTVTLIKTFVNLVEKYGRMPEQQLSALFFLKTNPLKLLGMIPLALKLFRQGKIPLFTEKIKSIEDLKKTNTLELSKMK